MSRRIYLASSWRNEHQPQMVRLLRSRGHDVYDFRNPPAGAGFGWEQLDGGWQSWTAKQYREMLNHPVAMAGFYSDYGAMAWADTCVLLLPCGRSAHLEAGWMKGAGKSLVILTRDGEEPELMALMADYIAVKDSELLEFLS